MVPGHFDERHGRLGINAYSKRPERPAKKRGTCTWMLRTRRTRQLEKKAHPAEFNPTATHSKQQQAHLRLYGTVPSSILFAGPRPCESCDTSAGRLVNITVRPIAHVLVSAVVLRRGVPPSSHGAGQACFQITLRTSSRRTTGDSARGHKAFQAMRQEKRGAFTTRQLLGSIRRHRAVAPRGCGESWIHAAPHQLMRSGGGKASSQSSDNNVGLNIFSTNVQVFATAHGNWVF